jgi:hypothetical protein
MVEKIREPYQKHARTISSVSDISTAGSVEPLKRDENAEIRCIILCDSETERNCTYESFHALINDGQSDIMAVEYLHHHWEQPYNECTGLDCRYCLRGPATNITFSSMNSGSGATTLHTVPTNCGDGFFRFSINNTLFSEYFLFNLSK